MNDVLESSVDARIPPQSLEAERAVLGAVLRENDRLPIIAETISNGNLFYREPHRLIWAAMGELYTKGESIDLLTLSERLRKEGRLEAAGGVTFLSQIIDATPTAANAAHYAEIVRNKAVLRGLIVAGNGLVESGYAVEADPEEALDSALGSLVKLRAEADPGGLEEVGRVLVDVFRDIDGGKRGLPTGFPALDKIVAGLDEGNVVVVASRPSIGKTAFALSVARYLALHRKERVGVAYFYLEAGRKDVGYRLLSAEGGLSLARIKAGILAEGDNDLLLEAAKRISGGPIYIDDTPRLTASKIRGRTWQLKVKSDTQGSASGGALTGTSVPTWAAVPTRADLAGVVEVLFGVIAEAHGPVAAEEVVALFDEAELRSFIQGLEDVGWEITPPSATRAAGQAPLGAGEVA